MLEIVSDIGDVRGLRDPRFGEPASLFGLGSRVIEFEDAQMVGRLKSIGEGVETRAENDNLPHALLDRPGRAILREAAAHRDEQAQTPPLRPFPGARDGVVSVLPQDGERERVGEYGSALENLMRGAIPRHADRGSARLSVLHGPGR